MLRKVQHMPGKPRYTKQQMINALKATRGMVYLAAKQLQCDPDTVMNYCRRYPEVEAAKHDCRGEMLDSCELRLWKAVQRDEAWAITFALRTVGRTRGYAEKVDVHLQIEMVAARVAETLGLRAEDVLQEAQMLLKEMDYDALQRPAIN